MEKIEDVNYWQNRKLDDERRDWLEKKENWVADYWASQKHPHRQLILKALKKVEPFESVLEVGSNAGPNLALIKDVYTTAKIMGVDVNVDAIVYGMKNLPEVYFLRCPLEKLDFISYQSFDVVISDATLLYVKDIKTALENMGIVAKKAIILCEWKSKEKTEEVLYGHYARDYTKLLELYTSFKDIEEVKITEADWPTSKKWSELGYIWLAAK